MGEENTERVAAEDEEAFPGDRASPPSLEGTRWPPGRLRAAAGRRRLWLVFPALDVHRWDILGQGSGVLRGERMKGEWAGERRLWVENHCKTSWENLCSGALGSHFLTVPGKPLKRLLLPGCQATGSGSCGGAVCVAVAEDAFNS